MRTSLAIALLLLAPAVADEPTKRLDRAKEFHARAQDRTGLLVPLYTYPADVDANPAYTKLIDLKRAHETVPVWVIVNPASGPGEKADANYTTAIDRLTGAGCVVIGYVTTGYGKRAAADVKKDVDRWLTLYPRVKGIFFDEMTYEDTDSAAKHQSALSEYAHAAGCWPTVGNPGADTPTRYFAANAADVIVVHEGDKWPTDERMKRYADHPPHTRGVLLHSLASLDAAAVKAARKHARWVYATDKPFKPGDPKAANPWDGPSKHLEELFDLLAK